MYLQKKFLNFNITGLLGSGSYGDVVSAIDSITSMKVAIKFIRKDADRWKHGLEPKIQQILNHKNICKLYGYINTSRNLVLVLELVNGMDLHKYIRRYGKLEEDHARALFVQILHGVDYLHTHSIVHRDLKLENIIVHEETAKICDFGLSTFYDRHSVLKDYCGTPQCAPPEIMRGIPYIGPEVDVWCLGIILYAMVHGKLPFESEEIGLSSRHEIISKVEIDESLSNELKDLIRKIIEPDKSMRIGMDQLMRHPWVGTTRENHRKSIVFVDYNVIERLVEIGFKKEEVLRNIPDRSSKEYSAYCLVSRSPSSLSRHHLTAPGSIQQCRPYNIVDLNFITDEETISNHQRRMWKHEILRGMSSVRDGCLFSLLWSRRKIYLVNKDMNLSLAISRSLIESSLATFPKITFRKKSRYVVRHTSGLVVNLELTEKHPFTTCTFTLVGGNKIEFVNFVMDFIGFTSQENKEKHIWA
ncbi:serine/threonine kinase [Encephalitozoon hellem]|nr:serine/threonine kinase [Encephalitozoon hellem]